MAFGLTQGIQLATGLAGLFGGKKKDPLAGLKKQYLNDYLSRQKTIWDRANNYDPMKETRTAIQFGQESAGRALSNASMGLNQRFKNAGGSPTGDTNFSLNLQRSADDILNPLKMLAAERASNTFSLKQQAMSAAMGAPPGAIADAYEATRSAPAGGFEGSQMAMMQALDTLFQKPEAKKSGSSSSSGSTGGKKKARPRMTFDPSQTNTYWS